VISTPIGLAEQSPRLLSGLSSPSVDTEQRHLECARPPFPKFRPGQTRLPRSPPRGSRDRPGDSRAWSWRRTPAHPSAGIENEAGATGGDRPPTGTRQLRGRSASRLVVTVAFQSPPSAMAIKAGDSWPPAGVFPAPGLPHHVEQSNGQASKRLTVC